MPTTATSITTTSTTTPTTITKTTTSTTSLFFSQGESKWNEAQSKVNVLTDIGAVDYR